MNVLPREDKHEFINNLDYLYLEIADKLWVMTPIIIIYLPKLNIQSTLRNDVNL